MDLPLLEGDYGSPGVIEPALVAAKNVDMPECAVLCFFGDVVAKTVAERSDARQVAALICEAGPHPVWEIDLAGRRLAVFQPGVGAPLAAVFLEEVIAMGCRRLIACGGAGALVPGMVKGQAVVVGSAVRDEGTSQHYLPPSRVIDAHPHAVTTMADTLSSAGIAHVVGRTWTTDAFYRETHARVDRRIAEGCVVVEMEAAALSAVAQYREVTLGQMLLASDSLAGGAWDDRRGTPAQNAREILFHAAAAAALAL